MEKLWYKMEQELHEMGYESEQISEMTYAEIIHTLNPELWV